MSGCRGQIVLSISSEDIFFYGSWKETKNWYCDMDGCQFFLQHCLPNCEETTYKATVSAAPFRRCDFKALGMNPLCDLNTFEETNEGLRGINPPIWGTSAFNHYRQAHSNSSGSLVSSRGIIKHYLINTLSHLLQEHRHSRLHKHSD